MIENIAHGAWPTMVTLFAENGELDLSSNAQFTDRLIRQGADGLFTVCQSSEMFFLSQSEKLALARCVVEAANARVQVIASGHTASDLQQQIDELGEMAQTGVDAVVLVTNRLARREDNQDVLINNLMKILDALPDVTFGIYECPYPSLRLLSLDELQQIASTNRVFFLKDVSCNAAIQNERSKIVRGSKLRLFNANSETLYNSLTSGYDGYNGIMGNFHIDIYHWYYKNYASNPSLAAKVQAFFTKTHSLATTNGSYPISAKYHLQKTGLHCGLNTRAKPMELLNNDAKQDIDTLVTLENEMRETLGLPVD